MKKRWNNCKSTCVLSANYYYHRIPSTDHLWVAWHWRCMLGKVQNPFLLTEKLFKQDPWKHWQLRAILLYFLHVAKVFYPDPVKDLSTYTTWADSLFETRETGHIKVTDGSWVCPFSWIRISCFKNISLQDITIIWK